MRFQTQRYWSRPGAIRRAAGVVAAVALVIAVGASSALFVDYLADRAEIKVAALQRRVAVVSPNASVETNGAQTSGEATALSDAPAAPAEGAARPAKVDPAHAIKVPAGEPTASPTGQPGEGVTFAAAPQAPAGEPVDAAQKPAEFLVVDNEESNADETFTAGIPLTEPMVADPETASEPELAAAEPPLAEPESAGKVTAPARPKPKRFSSKAAKQKPATRTEMAALPGVELGGIAASAPASGRASKVTKYVNLRSGPDNDAGVLAVVPAKASVSVLACNKWCQVVYKGKKGWVHKRFIGKS